MKYLVISSPFSKRGKINKFKKKINKVLSEHSNIVDFKTTEYSKHATKIAREACGKYDVIVSAGGDGMLNEIVCGIAEQENKPKVAFLPSGTVNDVARSLNIPQNLDLALDTILKNNTMKHDIFKASDRYGIYVITAGAFSETSYSADQEVKKKLGWWAYFLKGLKSPFVKHSLKFKITMDSDRAYEDYFSFVAFINSRSVASFRINKYANLADGELDVVLIKNKKNSWWCSFKNNFTVLKLFLLGIRRMKNSERVVITKCSNIKIVNPQKNALNVDGELAGISDLDVKVLKKEIEFIRGENQ